MSQRRIQGISNSKIYCNLVEIVLQDDKTGNHVSNDINFGFSSRTYPVLRVVALPRMASNVLNDVTGSTNPPATLQSIRGISYIANHITRTLTIRIKWPRCGRARPNDRHHSHSKSNRADTIIYTTFATSSIRWLPSQTCGAHRYLHMADASSSV